MMMQARPRTAGTAARRKQRALATARARSDSRAMGARRHSASIVANGTAAGSSNGGSGDGGQQVGPSMVIPKVLFILFMVCLIIGGILVAITTLEDAELGSTKLVGVFIIVGGSLFLIASVVVCLCKKAHWAADQDDELGGGTAAKGAAPTATSGSARRGKYVANHVEDETSRPPTRAWNMDGNRPTSAYSTGTTRDIEMTLTSDPQNDLFSISGAGNGGFQSDDQLTFRTTPQIKITCEEDEEKGGNVTSAADIDCSNSEDVKIVMADENLVDTARPAGIPALDLSGVFPSPSVDRKSFENEGFDLDDETAPLGNAPSKASFGTSSSDNSSGGTRLNQSNDGSDWSTGRSRPKSPVLGVNEDIELKVMRAEVTDNLDLIQPETTFKGSELISPDVTGSSTEKVGVSGNVSPSSETDDKRAEEEEPVPFDLGLPVGGRGRVE